MPTKNLILFVGAALLGLGLAAYSYRSSEAVEASTAGVSASLQRRSDDAQSAEAVSDAGAVATRRRAVQLSAATGDTKVSTPDIEDLESLGLSGYDEFIDYDDDWDEEEPVIDPNADDDWED